MSAERRFDFGLTQKDFKLKIVAHLDAIMAEEWQLRDVGAGLGQGADVELAEMKAAVLVEGEGGEVVVAHGEEETAELEGSGAFDAGA